MSDYTIVIKKHNYYDVSRYSESSESEIDSISDISLSDHELQLKEVVISSEFNQDFNNNNYNDNDEFDSEDYSENSYCSNDDDYGLVEDYNEQNDFDQKHNKSSFKALSFVCAVKGCSKKYTIKGSLKRHIRHHHKEKKTFVCFEPQCNIKFSTHDLLKRHQQVVHGNRLFYVCREKECDEKYSAVNRQIKGHEEIRSKKECTRKNRTQKQHISINRVRKQIYRCSNPGCNMSFDELFSYVSHLRVHPDGETQKIHHCDEPGCDRFFTNLYGLWNHVRFGHSKHSKEIIERTHKCEESGCDRSFDTLYGLWAHKRSHIRENPELEKTLKNHEIKIYTRKYPCKVPGCNRIFDSKSAVASHKRFHKTRKDEQKNNVIKKSYKCDVDKILEDNFHLENRRKVCAESGCSQAFQTHTNDKLEVSDMRRCGFKTEKFEVLKQRLSEDHNTKSYCVCDKEGCSFCCTDDSNLHKHQQIHVDVAVINKKEELFKCEKPGCDKVYKRLCHLRTHQNRGNHQTSTMFTNKQQNRFEGLHVEKKDYVCDEPGCDKIYKRLCHLKKHKNYNHIKTLLPYVYIENINLDIKQENTYYCDHPGCFYATRQVRNLTRHKMIHSGEKRFLFGIRNKIYASGKAITKGTSYNLRRRGQMSYRENQVFVGRAKTKFPLIKTKLRLNIHNNFRVHPRLNKHTCNHQGCNKRFITLTSLKKHKNMAHSTDSNKIFTFKLQRNVQVPITVTNDLVNRKRSSANDDLKGVESNIYPYGLRKRPRINKINTLNDDDDDCLCKFTGCRKIFDSIRSLKFHQQRFHMITKTYSCNKTGCNFRTKFFETLERHQIEKHSRL